MLIEACDTKEQADGYLADTAIDRDTMRKWRDKVADEMRDPLVFALLRGPPPTYPKVKNIGDLRKSLLTDLCKAHANAMSLEQRRHPGRAL